MLRNTKVGSGAPTYARGAGVRSPILVRGKILLPLGLEQQVEPIWVPAETILSERDQEGRMGRQDEDGEPVERFRSRRDCFLARRRR
jgi:hypothetical protein